MNSMNKPQFKNTSSHMVQEVINIIDDYKMGSLRALAQEPVQNALDAKANSKGMVEVEYRLLRRKGDDKNPIYLLTVTDTGTTGLRGPLVSDKELERRNFKLMPDENWAAFEARGYTKENEDALGSRGQGKSAFLYHSHVPGDRRRMLMLYDTLLENGEYRFGMRFAKPVDQVLDPPLFGDAAIQAVTSSVYNIDGLSVPLGLDPLREVGARVIVAFLPDNLVEHLRPGGEMSRWLQRCWWRAIQLNKLSISVVDDESDEAEGIAVPGWWTKLPRQRGRPSSKGTWHNLPDGGRACIWRNLQFDDGHAIRRLVLLHSDNLSEDKLSDEPEYSGIQVLRGMQWIETQDARREYGDPIPVDKRIGFRGFVEFEGNADAALRAAEHSTHDGFNGHYKVVRDFRAALREKVRAFCAEMGWESTQPIAQIQDSQRDQQTSARFLETFVRSFGRKPKPSNVSNGEESPRLLWDCRLALDFPCATSMRVDWGQHLRNVFVEVAFEPGDELEDSADLLLEWVDNDGIRHELDYQEGAIRKEHGKKRSIQQFDLGDWQIIRGKGNQNRQVSCPVPAVCTLRAVVLYQDERVAFAPRAVYIQQEPPQPPEKNLVSLAISAVNDDGGKDRIDHGETLVVWISARNRDVQSGDYSFTAELGDEILAQDKNIELSGTPAGDTPRPNDLLAKEFQLLDPNKRTPRAHDGINQLTMPEASGVYYVCAELRDCSGERVANASKRFYFQRDPAKRRDGLPFETKQDPTGVQEAMWEMNEELTLLTYPHDYPLRKELPDVTRQHRPMHGKNAFIAEINADGLLDWALRPLEHGDDANYQELLPDGKSQDSPAWEKFARKLEALGVATRSKSFQGTDYSKLRRETVAIMLEIFDLENKR